MTYNVLDGTLNLAQPSTCRRARFTCAAKLDTVRSMQSGRYFFGSSEPRILRRVLVSDLVCRRRTVLTGGWRDITVIFIVDTAIRLDDELNYCPGTDVFETAL